MSDLEKLEEKMDRVELMASGDPHWDLSENDLVALKSLIARVKELERRETNALFAGDPLEMKAKLQSARELAEMELSGDCPCTCCTCLVKTSKAREFLEGLE